MWRLKELLFSKRSLALVVVAGATLVALPVLAQGLDAGLTEIGAESGLGGGDGNLKVLIAKIIRVLLGFLGVIAIVIMLYGGYLWMTSAGNQERITMARKVLVNGLIGLVIILSAFAVVSFIITRFLEVTGAPEACEPPGATESRGITCTETRECLDSGVWGSWALVDPACDASATFAINRFSPSPPPSVAPKNAVVRIYFNRNVESGSVDSANVKVKNTDTDSEVSGTLTVDGKVVEFVPILDCAEDSTKKCFAGENEFVIGVGGGLSGVLADTTNEMLKCNGDPLAPANPCQSIFTTSNSLDLRSPEVEITTPLIQAPVDSLVDLGARATDDFGIAELNFSALEAGTENSAGIVADAGPYVPDVDSVDPNLSDPKDFRPLTQWDTTGLGILEQYDIKADVSDVDSNTAQGISTVTIVAEHCVNGVQDFDETDIDCGGTECLLCNEAPPVITAVTPNDGAPGNYITIYGRGFGDDAGKVIFLGADGDGDGDPKDDPAQCVPDSVRSLTTGDSATDGGVQIATDGQNNWIAVWSAQSFEEDADILYSVSRDNGNTWSAPAFLNNNADTDNAIDERPDIATTGDGIWVAVWDSTNDLDTETDKDILYSVSSDNGDTWSASAVLNDYGNSDIVFDRFPDIKADNQEFVVGWLTDKWGGDRDIAYAVSADGSNWSSASALNSNALVDSGNDGAVTFATDKAGNWVAVWQSKDTLGGILNTDYDIFVARSSDLSNGWEEVTYLNSNATGVARRDGFPTLATDGRGVWITAWSSGSLGDIEARYSISTDNGATWSTVAQLADNVATDTIGGNIGIEIKADPNGVFRAVWQTKEFGGSSDIATALSNNGGVSWIFKTEVNIGETGGVFKNIKPQIESSGAGRWISFWVSDDNVIDGQPVGSDFDILFAILKSCDDVEATIACNATNTWSDNQIIVEVPSAFSGPLEVQKSPDFRLTDRTDLPPGEPISDFQINLIGRPGLCEVQPEAACFSDPDPDKQSIVFKGKNFSALEGEINFGDAQGGVLAWTPLQIVATVPNVQPSDILVRVKDVNEEFSNPLNFRVNSCALAPRIDTISPNSGPNNQTATITGVGFGRSVGQVFFVYNDGTETEVVFDFPPECGPSSYWKDNQIIIKVPASITLDDVSDDPEYTIYVKRQDGEESNRDVTFDLNTDSLTPGFFCINPDNGPVGIPVELRGDEFGEDAGAVMFYDGVGVTDIDNSSWSSQLINTAVPDTALTGPVAVVNDNDITSNTLNFKVESCIGVADACEVGNQCCGDGSCRPVEEACPSPPALPLSSYRWQFKTGNPAPRVIESASCEVSSQSPSPWKRSQDACINSQISVRFTTDLDSTTLTKSVVIVEACGNDQNCGETTTIDVTPSMLGTDGFTLNPGVLEEEQWYQVTITTDIKSDKKVAMVSPYVWKFKTRSGPCKVASVSCSPSTYTLNNQDDTVDLTAGLRSANCNILACNTGDVAWNSSSSSVASLTPLGSCVTTATAVDEGTATATVTSQKDSEATEGQCKLTVEFSPPEVTEYFPACGSACLNSAVGATFSRELDSTSITKSTVLMFLCDSPACAITTDVDIKDLQYNFSSGISNLIFSPKDDFLLNTNYRVLLTDKITSLEGKSLVSNYTDSSGLSGFSWIFKTKDATCQIDRLTVSPKTATVNTIGATKKYLTVPYSSPDECSSLGQRLNPFASDYNWESSKTDVATISSSNKLPDEDNDGSVDDGDTFIDPLQIATAIGKDAQCGVAPDYICRTNIQTTTDEKQGISRDSIANSIESNEATLTLQCGFSQAGKCVDSGDEDEAPDICSNQNKSCTTDADCSTGVSGQPLNFCGGGTPVGTCSIDSDADGTADACSNDPAVNCLDKTTNEAGEANDLLCNFAVNTYGCCAVRPWVESITGSVYSVDATTEKLCRNAVFTATFSTIMDDASIFNGLHLEWLDDVDDGKVCDLDATVSAKSTTALKWWQRSLRLVQNLFTFGAGAAESDKWCRIQDTSISVSAINDNNGLPLKTKAILSASELLHPQIDYRVVVDGEDSTNSTVGAKSIFGIKISTNYVQGFPDPPGNDEPGVGDNICVVDRIEVNIAPELSQDMQINNPSTLDRPYDLFSCEGDDCNCEASTGSQGCRLTPSGNISEDQKPDIDGNQHLYTATAYDATNQLVSANFDWTEIDPQSLIELNSCNQTTNECQYKDNGGSAIECVTDADCRNNPEQVLKIAQPKNGFASVAVKASLSGVTEANKTVPVIVSLCKNPWSNRLQDGPEPTEKNPNPTNFYTTYCRDTSGDPLPDLGNNLIGLQGANPLGILSEWILKDPGSIDAIGVRVVKNERHLTPLEWYNEQPFAKGSPQSLIIDGYPAVRDGRTVYIGAGNAVSRESKSALYTNIYIFSYNQGAKSSTVNIFNQLVNNLVFNINKLEAGQCQSVDLRCSNDQSISCTLDTDCGSGSCEVSELEQGCLLDNDCSAGYICNNEKSGVARDVKRISDILNISSYLSDYQYGASCATVTPGAPGDANCNGVIDGYDLQLAQWYKLQGKTPPAYCQGADYDLDSDVDIDDVSGILNAVRANCRRSPSLVTNFPSLSAGSYIEGTSTSRWPSWVSTLGNDLGKQLPVDPLNAFARCEAQNILFPDYEAGTCWNPVAKNYASHNAEVTGIGLDKVISRVTPPPDVPWSIDGKPDSQVYTYSAYGRCDGDAEKACLADADCGSTGPCLNQGKDYALCGFLEGNYTPTPSALNQVTEDDKSRICIVTNEAVGNILPESPEGNLIDGGTIIPPDPAFASVRIIIGGNGAGEVNIWQRPESCQKPAGVPEAVCEFTYNKGENLNLTASADEASESVFGGWNGACNNLVGDCDLTLDSYKIVSLNFSNEATLEVSLSDDSTGDGKVVVASSSGNFSCPQVSAICRFSFEKGTTINYVEIIPDALSRFSEWSSCATPNGNRCENIVLNSNVTVSPKLLADLPTASLTVDNSSVLSGDNFVLDWVTTNADAVSITSNVSIVASSGSLTSLNGSATVRAESGMTSFTLSASGPGGEANSTVNVSVLEPTGVSLSVSKSLITTGECVDLTWSTVGATPTSFILTLPDGTTDNVASATQPYNHCPSGAGVKNYRLDVDGDGGSASDQVSVTVSDPVSINSFSAVDLDILAGNSTELEWTASNAVSFSITPAVSGAITSPLTVSPSGTTTYILTAYGAVTGDEATAEVTVAVHNAPVITAFNKSTDNIDAGDSVSLDWSVSDAVSVVSFTADVGANPTGWSADDLPTGSVTVTPTETTTYTLTVRGFGATTTSQTITVNVNTELIVNFDDGWDINWGDGTITGAGINCRPSAGENVCRVKVTDETAVNLVALLQTANTRFVEWAGCDSTAVGATESTCNLTMSNNRTVQARYIKTQELTVVVDPVNAGRITGTEIDCSDICTVRYDKDTVLTLTQAENPGFIFNGWNGASCASNTCLVTMNSDRTITVQYLEAPTLGTFSVNRCNTIGTACLAGSTNVTFSWSGWDGADTVTINPGSNTFSASSTQCGGDCASGSWTVQVPGSGVYSLTATNNAGVTTTLMDSSIPNGNKEVWVTWNEQKIADSSVVQAENNRHDSASPQIVATNNGNTVYSFFSGKGGAAWCYYNKGVFNSFSNQYDFTNNIKVYRDCNSLSAWYDEWTPGNVGNNIHLAAIRVSKNRAYYRQLDTTNDSLSDAGPTGSRITDLGKLNMTSVAKGLDNQTYIPVSEVGGSFVDQCTIFGSSAPSCLRLTHPYSNLEKSPTQIVSTKDGPLLLYYSELDKVIYMNYWDGADWGTSYSLEPLPGVSGAEINMSNPFGGFSAVVNPDNDDVYVAYKEEGDDGISGNDVIRFKYRDRSEGVTVWVSGLNIPTAKEGIADVSVAYDTQNDYVYIAYAERDSKDVADSAKVYYRRSKLPTTASRWYLAGWTDPMLLINTPGNYYSVSLNYVNRNRLVLSAVDVADRLQKIMMTTVNILTPPRP